MINSNWQGAKNAGIQYVDAYAFVCNQCSGNDPNTVCSTIAGNLPGGWNGQIWLDIEECDGCWSGDGGSNLDFVVQVAQACEGHGLKVNFFPIFWSYNNVDGYLLKLL